MNTRSCVYVVNQHAFYLRMVANSLRMLRQYNQTIPVRVFLIEDGGKDTVPRSGMGPVVYTDTEFEDLCGQLNVEVRRRPPIAAPGEEGFFMINRHYMYEIPEREFFHIDSDTFFFDDVEKLFEKYNDCDLAACDNEWVWTRGWTEGIMPFNPFNSGLLLWRNGHGQRWAGDLVKLCKELREANTPLGQFLESQHPQRWHREEFSVSLFVERYNLKHRYFDTEDCYLIKNPEDMQLIGKQVIFHCYTDQWREVFGKVNKKSVKPLKFVKRTRDG